QRSLSGHLVYSGHDHRVAALQQDVLLQPATVLDIGIAERQRDLLVAFPSQYPDVVDRGEWRRPSRQAQRLYDIDRPGDRIVSGTVDFTQHEDLVAERLLQRDGHRGVRDVFAQARI